MGAVFSGQSGASPADNQAQAGRAARLLHGDDSPGDGTDPGGSALSPAERAVSIW